MLPAPPGGEVPSSCTCKQRQWLRSGAAAMRCWMGMRVVLCDCAIMLLQPSSAGWGCVWCCATVLSCCCSPPVLDGDACGAVPLCCRVIAALQCQAPTFAPIAHLLPHKTLPEPPKVVLGARVVRHFLGGGLQGPAHCRQEGWPLRPVRRRDQQLRVQVGSACLRDKGKGLRATPTAVRKWLVGVRVRVNSKSGWTFSQLCATHTVCVCVYVHVCVCLCVCVYSLPRGPLSDTTVCKHESDEGGDRMSFWCEILRCRTLHQCAPHCAL